MLVPEFMENIFSGNEARIDLALSKVLGSDMQNNELSPEFAHATPMLIRILEEAKFNDEVIIMSMDVLGCLPPSVIRYEAVIPAFTKI